MIIEALVKIELKSDGTWQIVGLKALTETKHPEVQPPKPKPHQPRSMLKHFSRVDEHFRNRDRVRKKRAREKSRVPHHCSICGKAHRNCKTHPHV
jgi:hypothetical protein